MANKVLTSSQVTILDLNDGISIISVDVEYAISSSATDAPTTGWQTKSPDWVNGKYIWSRTKTTYSTGDPTYSTPACITGWKGDSGRSVVSIIELYKKLNTKEQQSKPTSDSGWSTTPPTWESGYYIHTCSKITYDKGTPLVEYTVPICDSSWEAINEVQIGANNFILHSNFAKKQNTYSTDGEIEVGNGIATIKNASNFKMDLSAPFGTLKRGDDIVLSSIATLTSQNGNVGLNKFIGGNINVYSEDYAAATDAVKKLKLNMITVPVVVEISEATSNDPAIPDWGFNRAKAHLDSLKNAGLITNETRLLFEPHPIIKSGSISETEYNPSDKSTFFKKWKEEIVKGLNFLNDYKFFGIYIGTNFEKFDTGEANVAHWENLINELKTLYGNHKLIYRTNWWTTATWAPDLIQAYENKVNNPLWGKVDIISIAAYFELNAKAIPTVDELYKDITEGTSLYDRGQNIFAEVKKFYDVWKKPVMFGELGCPSKEYGAMSPWSNLTSNADNQIVQANLFEAYNKAFIYINEKYNNDWFLGYSIFTLGTLTTEYNVVDKSAQVIINEGIDFIKNNTIDSINCQINNKDTNVTIANFNLPLSASLNSTKYNSVKLSYDASSTSELIFNMPANTIFTLSKPMLSNGTKASSWIPSQEDVRQDIEEVSDALGILDTSIKDAFGDDIVNDAEAKAIASNIQVLTNEKADIDREYLTIYANTSLEGTAKTNFASAKTAYNSAHTSLISQINTATADGKIINSERTNINNSFSNYRTKLADYKQRLQEALDYISTKKVDDIQIGGRNYCKNSSEEKHITGYYTTYPLVDDKTNLQDKYIIVSFDAKKAEGSSVVNMYTYLRSSTALLNPSSNKIGDVTTEYKRYVTYIEKGVDVSQAINVGINASVSSCDVYIKNVKVEEGNKASDYTPAQEDIDLNIKEVSDSLSSLDESVKQAFGDDIINDSEAKAIASNIQVLTNEKSDIDIEYTTVYNNTNLTGTAKTNLASSKTAYDSAHSSLISGINTATADKKITDAERSSVNSFFSTYRTKLADYKKKLQEALDYISTNKVDNIKIGGRNLLVLSTKTSGSYLTETGTIYNNAEWGYSDYIEVTPGSQIIASGYTNLGTSPATCFYNSSKTFVSGIKNNNSVTTSTEATMKNDKRRLVTIPSGCTYMRFSFMLKDTKIMLEKGNKSSDWTPAPEDVNNAIGNNINSVDLMYYLSTSSTELKGGEWKTVAPPWVDGKYMWSKTVTVLANGETKETTPTCIAGATGASGTDGKGIKSTAITYQASTSGTTVPTGTWSSTIPSVAAGSYLWTKTAITYTDGATSTSYSVGKMGNTGATGATGATGTGIVSITEEYAINSDKKNAPTTGWSTTCPTWETGKYIWTRSKIVYKNPTSTVTTTPVCDSSWEAVNEIQIGGRNLAQSTSNNYSSAYSSFSGVTNTCPSLAKVLTDGLSVGDTVTVRLIYKYTNIVATSGQTASCWIQGSGNVTAWSSGQFVSSPHLTLTGSGEHEFLYSFKVTADHLKNSYWSINIRHDYVQSGSVQWKMFKVEKGNKASDWTPAQEDVDASIGKAVKSVEMLYYLSTSSTSQSGGSWSTTLPPMTAGKFIWVKTKTTFVNGSSTETTPALYQPDWVQDWNGTKTTIGGTSVLAPKIFAGTKESDGTATGVALGMNIFGTGTDYSGIAGYKSGTKMFHFKTDGTVLIGKSTSSNHIAWDGSNLSLRANSISIGVDPVATNNGVTNSIKSIQIGGANILKNSDFGEKASTEWVAYKVTVSEGYLGNNAVNINNSSATSGYVDNLKQVIYNGVDTTLEPSQWYTLSFYAKGTGKVRTHIYPNIIDTATKGYIDDVNTTLASDGNKDWTLTSEWVRHVYTFKTKSSFTASTESYLLFRVYYGNNVYICMPQLEKGNKATDWSRSYDDISEKIALTEEMINKNIDNAIASAKDDILSNIISNYVSISSFNGFSNSMTAKFNQVSNDIASSFKEANNYTTNVDVKLQNYQDSISTYIRFNNDGIDLGKSNSPFTSRFDNSKIGFYQNGQTILSIADNKIQAPEATVNNKLNIGNSTNGFFIWEHRSNGNLTLKWSDK